MSGSEQSAGWAQTSLGEVIESMKNGLYKPADAYADDGIVCLRMYNIDNGRLVLRDLKRMRLSEQEFTEYQLLPGDLLVNRVNSRELVGKTTVIPPSLGPAVFESKNIRLRLHTDVAESRFISYQLLIGGPRYFAGNAQQVVGMASISQSQIGRFPIFIAPHKEQVRIVSKIEELFSDLDAGVAALGRARANLKRYRAAVLKAAVEGKLTERWRKEHPDVEPASKLLDRILAERRKKWEEAQLAKYVVAGKAPPKDWQDKYPEPAKLDTAMPDLPHGWCWATVEQLNAAERPVAYGVLQPGDDLDQGVPLIRVCDVGEGRLDVSRLKKIDPRISEQYQRTIVRGGEVVLTVVGTIGRSAVVPESIKGANTARAVAVIPVTSLIDSRYLEINLRESGMRARLTNAAHEVARKTLNLEDVRATCIPLAPIQEQLQIITITEERLANSDRAESDIEHSILKSRHLRQAILKRAFEGKLVPQDPDDEPSSVLLERIRAARAESAPPARNGRGKRIRAA